VAERHFSRQSAGGASKNGIPVTPGVRRFSSRRMPPDTRRVATHGAASLARALLQVWVTDALATEVDVVEIQIA
jgi:hypothetical protein